ncbi:MAG TPA: hypothetical protein VFH42_03840 [Sporolactobacillaceae bacterium]|nr:hypothetical protein [Sporolactobacillaceae bacterium]
MLYKIVSSIALIGCLILLLFVFLIQYKGVNIPEIKPVLWITIVSLIVRIILRKWKK